MYDVILLSLVYTDNNLREFDDGPCWKLEAN